MSDRIPEPHEQAARYYAWLDEQRARMLAAATCETCERYRAAPAEWAHVPFGWCDRICEWMEADQPAAECEEDYEPRCA